MSSLLEQPAAGQQERRATGESARPRLSVVPKPGRRAARVPFVLLVVLALGAGLVGLLVLNTSMQRNAFRAAALETTAAALLDRQQDLELEVQALRDPARVAGRARRLGMVPAPSLAFLRLSDGKVLGAPTPAPASTVAQPSTPTHQRPGPAAAR